MRQRLITRMLVVSLTAMICLLLRGGVASATTFLIIDCNGLTSGGAYSSTPFGQTSSCVIHPGTNPASVTTNNYASYIRTGSSANLTTAKGGNSFYNLTANYDTLTVGGPYPVGTPVAFGFTVLWAGTYSWSIGTAGPGDVFSIQTIAVGATTILYSVQDILLYAPGGSNIASYVATGGFIADVGQSFPFYWAFESGIGTNFGPSTISYDFIDPAQLSITAKDPTTGNSLSGVTLTGSDGFNYPVNATPEPSSLLLFSSAVLGSFAMMRRKSMQ